MKTTIRNLAGTAWVAALAACGGLELVGPVDGSTLDASSPDVDASDAHGNDAALDASADASADIFDASSWWTDSSWYDGAPLPCPGYIYMGESCSYPSYAIFLCVCQTVYCADGKWEPTPDAGIPCNKH